MTAQLEAAIESAWEARDGVTPASSDVRAVVEQALELLDSGKARVAEKIDGEWRVNQWLKKAVLLSFRLNDNAVIDGGGLVLEGDAPELADKLIQLLKEKTGVLA